MENQAGRNMTAHFTSRQLLTLPSPGCVGLRSPGCNAAG